MGGLGILQAVSAIHVLLGDDAKHFSQDVQWIVNSDGTTRTNIHLTAHVLGAVIMVSIHDVQYEIEILDGLCSMAEQIKSQISAANAATQSILDSIQGYLENGE